MDSLEISKPQIYIYIYIHIFKEKAGDFPRVNAWSSWLGFEEKSPSLVGPTMDVSYNQKFLSFQYSSVGPTFPPHDLSRAATYANRGSWRRKRRCRFPILLLPNTTPYNVFGKIILVIFIYLNGLKII